MFHELPNEPHKVYLELISHYKRFFYSPNYGLAIVHQQTLVNLNPVLTKLLELENRHEVLGQDITLHIEELQTNNLSELALSTESFLTTPLTWKTQSSAPLVMTTLLTRFHVKNADFYLLLVPRSPEFIDTLKSVSRQFLLMLQTEYRPMLLFDGMHLTESPPIKLNAAAKNYFGVDAEANFTLSKHIHPKDRPALASLAQYINKHKSTRSQLNFVDTENHTLSVSLQSYPINLDERSLVLTLLSDELMQYVQESKTQYNQQTLQSFFNYTKSAMLIVDKNMIVREMNIGFTHQFKYPEDDIIGKDVNNFLSQSILNNKIQTAETISQVELSDYYGTLHTLKVFDMPIFLEDEFIGKYLLFSDANAPMPSELKQLHQQLFNLNPEQVLLVDSNFEVCWSSSAYSASAEFPNDAMLKHPLLDFIAKESQDRFLEVVDYLKSGHSDWYGQLWLKSSQNKQKLRSVHISTLTSDLDSQIYYGLTINHIQLDRELEQLMIHFAFRDPWLELPNHVYAERLIDEWIYEFGAHQKQFSMFKLNIMGLDALITTGHEAEIDLLQSVLYTMTEVLNSDAKVARSQDGGFLICHRGINHRKDALHLIHTFLLDVNNTLKKSGHVDLGCHIGLATFPQDGSNYETLMSALCASQQDHQLGQGDLIRYEQMLLSGPKKEGMIIRYLKEGLHRGEFYIVYQPLIDLNTKKVIGIETLLRWENDVVGSIPP